ncbi:hypothetical protein AMIS_45000 [Actinoplanes missouriensis 431]|uniref:Uncharacterized protein n=1 Tax=Actinoplanes missouriensis (strain ATCC 14538 / DSM 43046 / CBS 188.64 / JCM 3121 / NBRC 102363 / NCIMB 12654 / NRRL B-3342 / UNCC 431) TaxID=512565 RepID=I0H9N3_ACTM4|nr:hypothetical protein [Actinoplanes missouriensis]BAL89720.1 hypothetical protein AMIS_45000 [Actinoplanes missouriensis 431]
MSGVKVYDVTRDGVEYVFGDRIAKLTQDERTRGPGVPPACGLSRT